MPDDEILDFEELLERSSFGTELTKKIRDQTPDVMAERILARVEELSEEANDA